MSDLFHPALAPVRPRRAPRPLAGSRWWQERMAHFAAQAHPSEDFQAEYFKHLAGRAAEPQAAAYHLTETEAEQLRQQARAHRAEEDRRLKTTDQQP